jgi:hypothetical protein
MNISDGILKAMRKQNQIMKATTGLNSISNIANNLSLYKNKTTYPVGLSAVLNSTNSISHLLKPVNSLNSILGNSLKSNLSLHKYSNSYFSNSLSSSLSNIIKNNQKLSNSLFNYSSTQLQLSNNLVQIAKAMNYPHLTKFNSLNIALQGVTTSYLKDIVKTRDWDEIDFAEQVSETIIEASEEVINTTSQLTVKDLDVLKLSIISELMPFLSKTKTEKARSFIIELITTISLLFGIYSTYLIVSDKTNNDVINETKLEVENISSQITDLKEELKTEIRNTIEAEFNKLNKKRVALTNVNLRKSPVNNSPIIGLVKLNQEVIVVEIHHKYLFITYIDKDTGNPFSGFVVKKYLKNIE